MNSVCDVLNNSKCEARTIYNVVGTEGDNEVKIKKYAQTVVF